MAQRKQKKEMEPREVAEEKEVYPDWMYGPNTIEDIISDLMEYKEVAIENGAIPDSITIEGDKDYGYYDNVTIEWTLAWRRMETPEQVEQRVAKAEKARARAREQRKKAKEEKEAKELKLLADLKAKYEKEGE